MIITFQASPYAHVSHWINTPLFFCYTFRVFAFDLIQLVSSYFLMMFNIIKYQVTRIMNIKSHIILENFAFY